MAEYSVVLAVITAAIILSFSLLSGTMETAFYVTLSLINSIF
jgi:Flp pilus assembly pilin Flp